MTMAADQGERQRARRRRLVFLVPVAVFMALAAAFAFGLTRDPSVVPSVPIDKPVPAFALEPVPGRSLALASEHLTGEVTLVNVFASWCPACRVEHPLPMKIEQRGLVPIHGIDYKDAPEDGRRWLGERGDPYTRTGVDADGRVGVDFGVYGVPETFLVDAQGVIRYKQVGPITPEAWEQTIWPLIQKLRP